MKLTVNNIVDMFARIQQAAGGDLIKSFRYGRIETIDESATDLYPLLFLEYPFNLSYGFKDPQLWKSISFNFLVLDRYSHQDARAATDGVPSIRDAMGKSEQTAEQILSLLYQNLDDCNISIDGAPSAFTLSEEFSDRLAGAQVALTLSGPSPVGICPSIFTEVDLCGPPQNGSDCYY